VGLAIAPAGTSEGSSYSAGDLCSLAEVKLQLGKTAIVDDAELQSYIDAVTDPIEAFCGAILPRTIPAEWHDVNGDTIVLRSERIVSVTSVIGYTGSDATTYNALSDPSGGTGYLVDPSLNGVIRLLGGRGYGRYVVAYVAGLSAVPSSINLAARLIVQSLWRSQNGGAGVPQLSDEPTVQFDGFDEPIPARAAMLLSRYRRSPAVA
jgi:hypothetical protein